MNELSAALIDINWSTPKEDFESIARLLFEKYVIRKGDKKYAIVEIEFYLHSNEHPDYITYPRDVDAGQWLFHPSGVDLTFKSDLKNQTGPRFGGILIRGLYRLNSDENEKERYIFGPQKCVYELWDVLNALGTSADEYPVIVRTVAGDNLQTCEPLSCKRCINIKEADRGSKIKGWTKRLSQYINVKGVYFKEISTEEILRYKEDMFDIADTMLYRYFNLRYVKDPYNFIKIPVAARPK